MDPQKLRYAKTHEWAYLEGDLCTVGLTQYAVEQLTDVIYIELPDLGDPVIAGDGEETIGERITFAVLLIANFEPPPSEVEIDTPSTMVLPRLPWSVTLTMIRAVPVLRVS